MQYTQEITLELNSNTAYTTIGAKQGDNNTRLVKVHLTENGEDYDLSDVSVAYFRFRKPDGKAIINSAVINDDNTISIILTAQTLAVAGRGYADITLQNGSQILSTVSFIIVIMSAPQVANEAVSSNEFGYLNAVVSDATHIIYEAEAWAAGTKGGQPVYREDGFTTIIGENVSSFQDVSVDKEKFIKQVTPKPGTERTFVFTFSNDAWVLKTTMVEGETKTEYDSEIITDLSQYGITLIPNNTAQNNNETITIILKEKDSAYNNNAKYWSKAAQAAKKSIDELTIETTVIDEDATASVDKSLEKLVEIIEKPDTLEVVINNTTFITQIGSIIGYYEFYYSGQQSKWLFDGIETNLSSYGITITGTPQDQDTILIYYNEYVDFNFNIPRGRTGNVNFMTFDIGTDPSGRDSNGNPTFAQLVMCRPTELSQVDFKIIERGDKEGYLGVYIDTGV